MSTENNDWYEGLTQEKLEQYLLDIAKAREQAEQVLPDTAPTRQTIADAVEYVFNKMDPTEPKRKFKILAGCKTYGTTDLEIGNVCMDPTCGPCSTFHKALKKEVEKWGNKTIDEHLKDDKKNG